MRDECYTLNGVDISKNKNLVEPVHKIETSSGPKCSTNCKPLQDLHPRTIPS